MAERILPMLQVGIILTAATVTILIMEFFRGAPQTVPRPRMAGPLRAGRF